MSGRKTDDGDLARMVAGHQRFKQTFAEDRDFYRSLSASGQRPRMLWIGCSDSRVVPDDIVGADPGELFVIRNIANVVPPAMMGDAAVGAAIEYAVMHLKIDDIVVCGHTGCGGMLALGQEVNSAVAPHFEEWVRYAGASHALVRAQGVPEAEALDAAAMANVLFQLDHLLTYNCVWKGVGKERIRLHGWLYDMSTGDILAYDGESGLWRSLSNSD